MESEGFSVFIRSLVPYTILEDLDYATTMLEHHFLDEEVVLSVGLVCVKTRLYNYRKFVRTIGVPTRGPGGGQVPPQ